jgi:4-amino-4-deoxy-L-arabinose transferase-like glycosyltransferase
MASSIRNSSSRRFLSPQNMVFVFLAVAYLATRLPGLTLFPVFTDEAMYIHIAQIIDKNWDYLFLTKVNAFKPLFIWVLALYQNIVSDPVMAGRLVSVTMGAVSVVGVYFLGKELFSERVGQVSSAIYIFCPFFIFHERLALMDTMVNAFGIWAIWISFRISKEDKLAKAQFVFLGILLGLAFFTKSTALAFFPAPFVIFFLWKTYAKINFFNYLSLTFLVVALINLPYFLTDQKVGYEIQNAIFSGTHLYIPLELLLGFPVDIWEVNARNLYVYLMVYLTFPVFLIYAFGILYALKFRNKTGITLLLLFLIPAIIILLAGRTIYARYYLEIIPPVIILTGWAFVQLINYLSEKLVGLNSTRANIFLVVFLALVVSEGITFAENLRKNPSKAFIPDVDRAQYLFNPRSGYGIKEAADFLISESKKTPITLMTWESQGNPQDGTLIYIWNKPNIDIIPAVWWPRQKKLFPEGESFPVYASKYQWSSLRAGDTSELKDIFFLIPIPPKLRQYFLDNNPEWKRVWSYRSYDGRDYLTIYKYSGE